MRYIVISTDTERKIAVEGKADTIEKARTILRNSFEEYFWEIVEEDETDNSFEDVYKEYAGVECEITEDSAWLNGYYHCDIDWKIIDTFCDSVLQKPYTVKEMIKMTSKDGTYIEGNILIDMGELIDSGIEEILDSMSESLVGNPCLMDINYTPIDVRNDGMIVMRVSGDVSEIMVLDDDMMQELKDALLNNDDASKDFIGTDNLNLTGNMKDLIDETIEQMPDEELVDFYRKYVMEENSI